MEDFKKFNAKSYLKHLSNYASELPDDERYKLLAGVYLLWKDLAVYHKNRLGGEKRLQDLTEYLNIIHNAHLKKIFKDTKELPY